MSDDAETLRRLDCLIWAAIAPVAVIVFAAPLVSVFYLVWPTFAAQVLVAAGLTVGAWFYRTWRSEPRIASGLGCMAQLIAFTAVGAPLSYIVASANLP